LWWEAKPMTYAPWGDEDRLPKDVAQFVETERYLLYKSPFLREEFDWNALAGQKVLDLGCGSGVLSCRLARHGAIVTAVDITEQGTRLAHRNAELQGVAVEVVRSDAECLTFADASFDFVLAWGVLHHSRSTEFALAEVARVLRPGGRGLMMVYHRASLFYWFKGLFWLILRGRAFAGESFDSVTKHFVDGYYHRHFTKRELARALIDAGLEPQRLLATQQQEPILPGLGGALDSFLKRHFGWYLVAEFRRASA